MRHGLAKFFDKLDLGMLGAIGEFPRPIANVELASNSVQDPLPQVAAQMQENILNAVVRLMLPPPQIGVGQLAQAMLYLFQGASQRPTAFRQIRGAKGCLVSRIRL
jgi:hypothetical protein